MTSIYCHGKFSEMVEKEGWWWCSGCGKRLWLTDRTFTLPYQRVPSGHATKKDSSEEGEEGGSARSGRGEEAGGV